MKKHEPIEHELIEWERSFADYLETNLQQEDGSHDISHFQRVWKAADYINTNEGGPGDRLVLLTSAYFHDLVSLSKNHPDRKLSSSLSADRTALLLSTVFKGFPEEKIDGVRHAIQAHSFSAGIAPVTIEAKILQDADRLEAVGAIGLARVFYTAGKMGQRLFDPGDPRAAYRELNDQQFALDHFAVKLLKLPALMNTKTGRSLADKNAAYLIDFLHKIEGEIAGRY